MGEKRSGLYLWVDQGLKGGLEAQLRTWRTDLTVDQIVDELRDLGFTVSRQTVNRWCLDLGIAAPVRSATA